jgi:hypothetical protein
MNFNDYYYVYLDSLNTWHSATNPEFIAEHKHCKAFKKSEVTSLKNLLSELNRTSY